MHHFLLSRITSARLCFMWVHSELLSWCQASLQEKEAKLTGKQASFLQRAGRDRWELKLQLSTGGSLDAPLPTSCGRRSPSPPHPLPEQDCEREATLPCLAQRRETAAYPGFVIRALTLERFVFTLPGKYLASIFRCYLCSLFAEGEQRTGAGSAPNKVTHLPKVSLGKLLQSH